MPGLRKTGIIRRWNTERGFGFIRSPSEGADLFFHVRDWRGSKLPAEGASVEYEEIHVGGKGPRAVAVRLRGDAVPSVQPVQESARRSRDEGRGRTRSTSASRKPPHARWWWPALLIWLVTIAAGVYLHRWPVTWAAGLVAINMATFVAYMFDKSAAQRHAQRVPESTLHLLSLIGGWPGARLAQQAFRHKSSKVSFQNAYAVTVWVNTSVVLAWVFIGHSLGGT